MVKENIQKFPIFITLSCLCAFMAQLFRLPQISSLCFYSCFILVLCNFIYLCIFKEIILKEIIPIIIVILMGIMGIMIKTQGQIKLSYFNTFIFLIIVLISLYNNSNIKLNDRTLRLIVILTVSVSFIYICAFLFRKNSMYWNANSDYLTFGLSNPNLAGMFLLFLFLYNFIGIFKCKNFFRIICLIASLFLLYFIVETKSRSCLLAVCFFIFAVIVFYKLYLKNWLIFVGLLVPLLFVVLYMLIIENGVNLRFLSFLVDEGKELNSRYEIWKETLEVIKNNLFLGNYYIIGTGTGNFQRHNIWLQVLVGFGFLNFVIVFYYFYYMVTKVNRLNSKDKLGKIAIVCFITIIVQGIFEGTILSGALGLFALFAQFLSIRN